MKIKMYLPLVIIGIFFFSINANLLEAADDEAEITRILKDYPGKLSAGDVDGMMLFYADDAVVMRGLNPPDIGREEIRKMQTRGRENYQWDISLSTIDELRILDDFAFARVTAKGTFLRSPSEDLQAVEIKTLFIFQRQDDRSWEILYESPNSNHPPKISPFQDKHTEMIDAAQANDQEAIDKLIGNYGHFLSAADAANLSDLFTDDGIFFINNSFPIKQKVAIKSFFHNFFEVYSFDLSSRVEETMLSDDWGYARVFMEGTQTRKADGQTGQINYHQLMILKRDKNSWKIYRAMSNSRYRVSRENRVFLED